MSSLDVLLKDLQVPHEFANYEEIIDAQVIISLELWKGSTIRILQELRAFVATSLSISDQAQIISTLTPFEREDVWVDTSALGLSNAILKHYSDPDPQLLEHILERNIRPAFQSSPHPHLNLSTGRKLHRQAGGPMASQDHFENQTWKANLGISNLVSWCVRHIKAEDYERLWHLIIPPIMILLDDYEMRFKLKGVKIVQEMLKHVPNYLLKRTGIDELLRTSFKTCFGFLRNPESAEIVRQVTLATVSLIQLTATPGSAEYFDQLCVLLGEGLIGMVWTYAADDIPVISASMDVLPTVVCALGIGTSRYLKAIIPQLMLALLADNSRTSLQISSLRALVVVMDVSSPRVVFWKGHILSGICRCWVNTQDEDLKHELRIVCRQLAHWCPSVIAGEYNTLLTTDHDTFNELVGPVN